MLTTEKATEIKELLSKVNIRAICKKKNLRYASVFEALNGKSSKLDTLKEVVRIARTEVAKRSKDLESL